MIELTPYEGDCPFPFFFDETPDIPEVPDVPEPPAEAWYKIYNDGSHYVATRVLPSKKKPAAHSRTNEAVDILFDSLYYAALKDGLKDTRVDKPLSAYVRAGMEKVYPTHPDLDGMIEEKVKRKLNNYHHRAKRFRRKAYMNRWNRFVTITYSDEKHDEQTFRKKLRKCLSNLHTRRGWKYMGVFERAPETGRLHFHGLLYVPDGEMIGKLYEREDYSTAQGQMQKTNPNTFFEEAFGRNDFEELSDMELKSGDAVKYLLKYISKTGERIVYSRGIRSEICMKLPAREIATHMFDYVQKYVLFDDTVNWERDIMRYKPKQLSILDLLCRSPQAA